MFDWSTGQVFREWTMDRHFLSVRAAGESDWSRRRPYPLFTPRGSRGTRSLVDTAINVIANNIGDVPDAYLEFLPARLRWRIWRFLEARGVCLHAWKLFSKQLLREDDEKTLGLYRFRQHICSPADELKSYTQPLTCLSTDFITHLVISGGCDFSTNELLCLADVKNLGVLELIQPADEVHAIFPHANDRLIRGWTEMDDPFPLLRILRIWGDQSTTQESLRWVSKFPRLALYDVLGSREDWRGPMGHVVDGGWEMSIVMPGPKDSLLRDLMLFAPLQDTRSHRDLARTVDLDLVSLSNDSRCAVKFVADRKAPSLLDYLTDTAKVNAPAWHTAAAAASSDARSCHGVAFEPWAFWLYSLIGQLTHDNDMTSRGIQADVQAVVGPFVLPSKPFASLYLGHSGRGGISVRPSYVSRGLFATERYVFTRSAVVRPQTEAEPRATRRARQDEAGVSERGALSLRKQKRRRLDHVLQSFSN
ncbi:succinyl-3-ketoacid-coenzyme a transferase [Hirsutella rhossiliensis]|uniref:Succinyl-3-ketoacid-coenzyme a transferase n=1 Tax=Hirsutella rhossiliensis TaxID=111463 RepID=A0A9P8MP77_9HYPO|nr:succinyl-3-ketoacid-coenzyme a transferase [Hirsutella rhossiliensis]KAH0958004.1 succinyl-3-ketoacid-coenzyme a transferase [Hirsutella rhossiliensis]